jgi:tRNA-intron lyase
MIFKGKLVGLDVLVEDLSLFEVGQFGKGSHSRTRPINTKRAFLFAEVNLQNKKRKKYPIYQNIIFPLLNNVKKFYFKFLFQSVKTISQPEVLLLSLQEAFYLIYVLECLEITKNDEILSLEECWNEFCNIQGKSYFITRYIAFHYYRNFGWTVKSGLKYGCDFVLYSKEIEKIHAEFCVLVIVDSVTWRDIQRQTRLSNSVAKTLLICTVKYSDEINYENINKFCSINDISVKRLELE